MKKFVSIIAVVIIIAAMLVGATACGGTDKESQKLIGTWISVVEDNNNTINPGTIGEMRIEENFYAEITETEQDGATVLKLKTYSLTTKGGFSESSTSSTISKEKGVYSVEDSMGSRYSHLYTITLQDDNTFILLLQNSSKEIKYTFRRTEMTLEEFKALYDEE